jgi:hypothetical protein
MLAAEAPEHNPRQAGLLADGSGENRIVPPAVPGRPSRGRPGAGGSGSQRSGGLADHSGGPATDSHRFPSSPPAATRQAEPVETGG